jgi:hypothetical protein
MDTYIYIACLRQVVAFAPKVIKCAYGAIKGNKMRRLKPKGFIESSTLGVAQGRGWRYGWIGGRKDGYKGGVYV